VKWQDGKSKIVEVRRNFSIITVAQRLVKKMGEEGFYLYLKRQSEGILMSAKCWFLGKRVNLYEGGAPPRVLGMD
jgi:hypothetical protein